MSFFERYVEVDEQLMKDGAEIDFGDDFFVTIRHVSAEKVTQARAKITQSLKVMSRNKELTPAQSKEITIYVAANAGVVSWRGGDAPEFTPEIATSIFKARPEFLEDVVTAMTSYEAFRKELVDEAAGNSQKSLTGE